MLLLISFFILLSNSSILFWLFELLLSFIKLFFNSFCCCILFSLLLFSLLTLLTLFPLLGLKPIPSYNLLILWCKFSLIFCCFSNSFNKSILVLFSSNISFSLFDIIESNFLILLSLEFFIISYFFFSFFASSSLSFWFFCNTLTSLNSCILYISFPNFSNFSFQSFNSFNLISFELFSSFFFSIFFINFSYSICLLFKSILTFFSWFSRLPPLLNLAICISFFFCWFSNSLFSFSKFFISSHNLFLSISIFILYSGSLYFFNFLSIFSLSFLYLFIILSLLTEGFTALAFGFWGLGLFALVGTLLFSVKKVTILFSWLK